MTPVAMMREYERAESQVSSNTKSCLGYLKIPWNLSHLNLEFLQDYGNCPANRRFSRDSASQFGHPKSAVLNAASASARTTH